MGDKPGRVSVVTGELATPNDITNSAAALLGYPEAASAASGSTSSSVNCSRSAIHARFPSGVAGLSPEAEATSVVYSQDCL